MLRKSCKSISAWLLALLMMLLTGMTVLAAETSIDFDKKGSLTITLRETDDDHMAIPGGRFTLYRVAELVKQNNGLNYRYTPEFADCGASLAYLNEDGLAEHLAGYAKSQQIVGMTMAAGENGSVTFSDLSLGLYLVVQEGEISGYYSIAPFLVAVPMAGSDDSGWLYDVEANPKAEPTPELPDDTVKLTVKKLWEGEDDDRPDHITVHLLRNGEIYKTVVLNDENNWRYTWDDLDGNYRWSVVEADVPDGYTVHYSERGTTITITNTKEVEVPDHPKELTVVKVWSGDKGKERPVEVTVELWKENTLYDTVVLNAQNGWKYHWTDLPQSSKWKIKEINIPKNYKVSYSVDGVTITVKNTYTTDTPGDSLIETGQLDWPIPILAGAGLLLFVLGWILVYAKKDSQES